MSWLTQNIKFTDPTFLLAAACIMFNPTAWNYVARREHNTRFLTQFFGGSHYKACYFLAFSIFTMGIVRDYLFTLAMDAQPTSKELSHVFIKYFGAALVVVGSVFVFSSMYVLGITGTYLGDYCGILMKERVTSFPFSVLDNPMYWGSTMNFLGTALWRASIPGVVLSIFVGIVYKVAISFEGPFTARIYAEADKIKKAIADVKRAASKKID